MASIVVLSGGRFIYMGISSEDMKQNLGVSTGKLSSCPDKKNCVCSFEDKSAYHYIKPIKSSASISKIKQIILAMKNTKLITENETYLYITFTSSIFGFVDDLEVLKSEDVIHIRSASRVGYSDLGANRKRVEKIRRNLTK